jgi:hypothetical protein
MPKLLIDVVKQCSLTKYYWRAGQRVLFAIQQPVIELAGNIDVESLKLRIPYLLKHQPMNDYISEIWIKAGSIFAVDMMKRIERAKKQEEDIDWWEDHYRRYMRERTLLKTHAIMDTQAEIVNGLIDKVIERGIEQGWGVDKIQRAMRDDLVEGLTEINRFQAERIARTEVMGASNTGSFEGAKEEGVAIGKEWMTSGLPNIRQSHLDYEAMGTVDMDYEYNTGLQYPCDPNGDPDEIINCRCVPTYSTD